MILLAVALVLLPQPSTPWAEVRLIESLAAVNAPPSRQSSVDRPQPVDGAGDSGRVPAVWHDLATCESGRGGVPTWDYDGSRYGWGNGLFDGGLQFHPTTWNEFAPRVLADPAEYAWQETPARQVEVAREVLEVQGEGAWPSCGPAVRLAARTR